MGELTPEDRERLEDAWRRSREAAHRAPTQTVVMVAGGALGGWLVLLPTLRAVAQSLYRAHGVEGFWRLVVPSWNLVGLLPVGAVCCAAAIKTHYRGALQGVVVLLAASSPAAYFAYAAFAANERDLAAHRWTASAMDAFFATLAMYPAAGFGALVGLVVARMLPRPGGSRMHDPRKPQGSCEIDAGATATFWL